MEHFDIHNMKKQASFYLREKVKSARLALTNVSRIQLLTEEATNADPWGPETRTMAMLSEAAFDLDEYERIVQVLHSRLDPNAKRPWRQLFKTLTVLEYMLTHGPSSLSDEFRADTSNIEDLCQYNLIDQQGIDRGVGIRNKADHVLELLSKSDLWKKERSRAQKISNGILGFGSSMNSVHDDVKNMRSDASDIRSDLSELVDEESELLLSDDTSQPLQPNASRSEWKAFEKCTTIPSYVRHDDGSSPSTDEGISVSAEPSQRNGPTLGPYTKSLSSPGHFRSTSPMIWQGFFSEPHKAGTSGNHIPEPKKETGDPLLLQESHCVDKEVTPSGDILEMDCTETSLHEKVVQPRHLSMRRLFDFQKSMAQANANCTKKENVEAAAAVEAFQTQEHIEVTLTQPGNTSNLPIIPPPPPSKYRRRIKHHFQPSNLLDL